MRRYLVVLIFLLSGALCLASRSASALSLTPGELVVSGTGITGAGLIRVDSTTGAQSLISSGSFSDFALADRETIYAIEGGAVVRIEVSSGTKSTISSGGLLIDPQGIAVDASGQVQVLDLGLSGDSGSIVQVDPITGSQGVLSADGWITAHANVDLELSQMGDLIVLDLYDGCCGLSEVFAVDVMSGQQTLLYSDPTDSPAPFEFLYTGTGLGIAPNGDIYVSNGTAHALGVLRIDAETGEATNAGHIIACCYLGSDGTLLNTELHNTDIAFADDGSGWMVGYGIGGSGLWRWNGGPLYEDGDVPFSVGNFDEVQLVSSALAVPEPSTALLLGLGLAGLVGVLRR